MSKMSDMAATIEELRTAAAAINDAANWLAEMFSGAGDAEPTAPAEPALTLEQVRAVLAGSYRRDPLPSPEVWCRQAVPDRPRPLQGTACRCGGAD